MDRLIDTHCHLCHGKLRPQVDDVLARARRVGVSPVICAAGDLTESRCAVNLARDREDVHAMAGIHPHDAKNAGEAALRQVAELAAMQTCVAVGEIGLDYHYDFSPREDQQRAFAAQIDFARRLSKPIVVHTREAFDETMDVLAVSGVDGEGVLFHSFTGGVEQVRRVLDFGAWVSFSGIVTFRNAGENREAARLVPADRILVETDAPYLAPEPVRKIHPNEPALVVHTARHLAELREADPADFAAQATANAKGFFRLPE